MIGDFNKVARYLAYTLEILVLFMVQETPGLLPSVLGCLLYTSPSPRD